jgi:hypothetical protein
MTPVTICWAVTDGGLLPRRRLSPRLSARAGEGTYSEVKKGQCECSCQRYFTDPRCAGGVTMILADCRSRTDQRKHKEQEPGHLQPEHMQHPPHAMQRDTTSAVKRANPTILACLAARNA